MISNMASNVATVSQSSQIQQGKQRRPSKTNWSDTNNGTDGKSGGKVGPNKVQISWTARETVNLSTPIVSPMTCRKLPLA